MSTDIRSNKAVHWAKPPRPTIFSHKNLRGKFCLSPWQTIGIESNGDVVLCHCSAWMPQVVGNLYQHNLKTILSSSLAQSVRASIINGDYRYCDHSRCGVIQQDQLIGQDLMDQDLQYITSDAALWCMPTEIWISGDITCNLSCPSCRTRVVKVPSEQLTDLVRLGELLKSNLFSEPTDEPMLIHVSISGEVFASPLLLSMLQSICLKDFPNIRLALQTNGLLMPRNWSRMGAIARQVESVTVSIDAATAPTYQRLRRGGLWPDLLAAMNWLGDLRQHQNIHLTVRMVCQRDNYHEISAFYDLGESWAADRIEFSRIHNWNTYSAQEFQDIDVFSPSHALFDQAQNSLAAVRDRPKTYLHGGLA